MKLRTKLTIGMGLLLLAAVGMCCGNMIIHILRQEEDQEIAYTVEEERSLLRQLDSQAIMRIENDSDRTVKGAIVRYFFSQLARTSSEGSQFVLQGDDSAKQERGTEDLYNNSGLDAWAVLREYGEREREAVLSALIRWEKQYYCIAGAKLVHGEEIYYVSVVRNITEKIDQVRALGIYCGIVSAVIMVFAGAAGSLYLRWQLAPLQRLQRAANEVSGRYAEEGRSESIDTQQWLQESANEADGRYAEEGRSEPIDTQRWFQRPANEAAVRYARTGSAARSGSRRRLRIAANGEKNRNEVEGLSRSFALMQDTVETYIGEVEQRAAEQKLLIGAITHELRTPVTAITGYAYALNHARLDEAQIREAVEFIDSESRRLERLSTKLTELVSLEYRQIELRGIPLDEFAGQLRRILANSCAVVEQKDSGLATICGDRDLITILITNLLDNACKAGATEVFVYLSQGQLQVEDNGAGIPEEELDKILQPFYQGDASRKQEGFGLGLALCRRIIELHHAKLSIDSEVGRGSCFTVNFL